MTLALAALLLTVALDRSLDGALLGLIAVPFGLKAVRAVDSRTDGPSLNRALADVGVSLATFALGASLGLILVG
jgi:1,4-dihydroxy-2-naphthoate octaprenyltransferase